MDSEKTSTTGDPVEKIRRNRRDKILQTTFVG